MGAIIVELEEPQPRADKHGQKRVIEALRILCETPRRVRRARGHLPVQPRLQRHVALLRGVIVDRHGNLLVPSRNACPLIIAEKEGPGLVRVSNEAGATV